MAPIVSRLHTTRLARALWCLLAVVCALWLPARAHAEPSARAAATPALIIDSKRIPGLTLGKKLDYIEDRTGTWTLDDVTAPEMRGRFKSAKDDVPSFGLTTSTYWVRFTVDNRTSEPRPWLLEVAYPPIDDLRLYVPLADGGFELRRSGDHLPFAAREVDYRTFLFRLTERPGTQTYYLRVQTSGSVSLPLIAWDWRSFLIHTTQEQALMWLFYGFMLVMAAYNLFVYLSVRDAAYLYYVFYILSYTGFQFSLNGYAFQFLCPNSTWWNGKALVLFIALSFAAAGQFFSSFLRTWEQYPRLHRISRVQTWISLSVAFASLFLSYSTSVRIAVLWGFPTILSFMAFGCYMAVRGSRQATFYSVSWLVLLLGIMMYLLKTLGVLPGMFVTDWGLQIGAALEVTLLSLGLADRINEMRASLQRLNAKLSVNIEQLTSALRDAEAATRNKAEFLASVSHELRTPLNAIINIPEGLLDDFKATPAVTCAACSSVFALESGEQADLSQACPECGASHSLAVSESRTYSGSPEHTARHLGYIHKSSKHLLEVVNSILDYGKLEAARMELNLADVSLKELLEDALPPLQGLAQSKGVQLVLMPCTEPCRVRGDRLRITQVVLNLIGNALKFSDGRGEVRVELRPGEGKHEISVHDQGIGIPAEHCARIFESFSQVDSGDTRRFGGTGLGLAISKQLVELHDGSIWVTSEVGKGSTFTLSLPVTGPRAPRDEASPLPRTSESPSRRSARPSQRGAQTHQLDARGSV